MVWSAYYHFLATPSFYPPAMIGRVLGCNTLVVAFMGDLLSHRVERVAVRTPAELPPISGCRGMDLQKDRRMMMRTKEEITQTIKEQFVNVRERGRVLAQALKARADIAATRRRMRSTFADLGEAVYARLDAGESVDLEGIGDYKLRIEGLKAVARY